LSDKVDVSVILCAYNEGDVIGETIDRVNSVMDKTEWNYEIVVVDDGSLDGTRQKAFGHVNGNGGNRLKVIGHEKNLGKGKAIRTGFANAEGEFIVVIDSDLDVSPSFIPSYVKALETNDIVVASKWHRGSHIEVTLKRRILSFGFNALSKLLVGIKLDDTQTGLKALRRQVLDRMSPKFKVNRYAFDLELIGACNHAGYRIVTLPVDVSIRSMVGFKEILRMTVDAVKIAYRLRVLKYYQRD
jgi:glycosyltransferase involved in cell wall biosynthesis